MALTESSHQHLPSQVCPSTMVLTLAGNATDLWTIARTGKTRTFERLALALERLKGLKH